LRRALFCAIDISYAIFAISPPILPLSPCLPQYDALAFISCRFRVFDTPAFRYASLPRRRCRCFAVRCCYDAFFQLRMPCFPADAARFSFFAAHTPGFLSLLRYSAAMPPRRLLTLMPLIVRHCLLFAATLPPLPLSSPPLFSVSSPACAITLILSCRFACFQFRL